MQNKIKILTIVYDLGIGGTQRAAQNFAIAYHVEGYDSRVLPVYEGGARKDELMKLGLNVYSHGVDLDQSLHLINQWQPDLLHIHRSGEADPFLSKILQSLKKGKIKVIETNVFSAPDNSESAHLVDVHCHLSEWCIWRWKLFVKNNPLGIVIPYLVLKDNFYKETAENILRFKRQNGLPENKFIFGRLGQKSPAKFHREIYLSFERLYAQRDDIHLFIVGVPVQFVAEIHSLNCFINGGVTLVDSVVGDEELRLAYNSMDCFLHYSTIGESFGMVLAEAQLCEIPVLTVSTPKADNSQLEVLIHGKSAIIVKNDKLLEVEMEKFIDGAYPLRLFGHEGRQHIMSHFTPEVLIPRINQLFFILLNHQQFRDEILSLFNPNKKAPTIEILKKTGLGQYNSSSQLFLIMPKAYLVLANLANKLKMKFRFLR